MTLQRSQPVPANLALQELALTPEHLIASVDEVMINATQSNVRLLEDACRHIISAGGKRIRPQLLLLTYAALGGTNTDYALPVAASVELVHTASVVHDDINDHGVVRRGRPSVNALYGRTFALLTGDFMFTKVYELMAEYTEANKVLAAATMALVEGETLQAAAVKENNLSQDVYMEVIALKTAELFRAATQLGALLADADEEIQQEMGEFGFEIGMAFQIIDDILDITGDTEQLGKTAGIDIAQGKGFASVSDDTDGDPMEQIRAAVMNSDMIERGMAKARRFVESALDRLDVLPEGEAKDRLIDVAHSVIERTY
jgi:octaprenyl-diphosphate synthase